MREKKAEKLFCGITNIREDIIEEAQTAGLCKSKPARIWRGVAAACVCVLAVGAVMLLGYGKEKPHTVLSWSAGFRAEDYFKYSAVSSAGESAIGSLADVASLYAQTRYFSDERAQLEAEGGIPVLDSHPLFDCAVHYNADGSIFSVEFSWHRRGELEDYSDLKMIAGYEEVKQVKDCIYVEMDENGNIVEPAITVTRRDGVEIVAEGRENRDKTITFQNESGWYQITGSWNDSYESVVLLLDWLWEHPVDFTRYPLEAGDEYTICPLTEYPEAFAGYLPDFAAFGYSEGETYLSLKNGFLVRFEGHYAAHGEEEVIHWCLETEPDCYELARCTGALSELTEQMVTDVLAKESSISFTWDGYCVTVYPKSAKEAWELIASLRDKQ